MSFLITSSQHPYGSSIQSISQAKETKRTQIEIEEIKLSLFTGVIFVYIENAKELMKNHLELKVHIPGLLYRKFKFLHIMLFKISPNKIFRYKSQKTYTESIYCKL